MAEFIFKDMVNKKGIANEFYIDSAATSNYNELDGAGIYGDAKKMLKQNIDNLIKLTLWT